MFAEGSAEPVSSCSSQSKTNLRSFILRIFRFFLSTPRYRERSAARSSSVIAGVKVESGAGVEELDAETDWGPPDVGAAELAEALARSARGSVGTLLYPERLSSFTRLSR